MYICTAYLVPSILEMLQPDYGTILSTHVPVQSAWSLSSLPVGSLVGFGLSFLSAVNILLLGHSYHLAFAIMNEIPYDIVSMAAEYHLTPVVALVSSFIFLHIRLLEISVGRSKRKWRKKGKRKEEKRQK